MNSINANFSQNISHPEYFFVTGLSGIPYSRYFYIFLFCIYIIAVIGNSTVLLIIALDRSLHSPKYIGVFNLALADIGATNALIPNMMRMFVFESQYISYNACLANMFFVFFFSGMQCFILVALSFDRVIAICLPLRYHAIVNNTVMLLIYSALWAFNGFVIGTLVILITRLKLCKSNVIKSFFCDHGPVYMLACNDNSINHQLSIVVTVLYVIAPMVIVVLSYVCIFLSLSKITSWKGRFKALKTCASHMMLVGTFFLPVSGAYIAALMFSLPPNDRIISTSLSFVIPPMLNPLIYVLNTAEIKDVIRKVLYKRSALITK
nr:olfactory receptor 1M1-like [Misgurnus anguillicaudatus]